jgi:hypothetical protein
MTQGSGFDSQLWQRRAVHVLGALLQRAARDSLPPIVWSVGTGAPTLIGRVPQKDDPQAQRFIWRAWANAVGATPLPARRRGDRIHLHAIARGVEGMAVVSITTDLHPHETSHRSGEDNQ